jgi:hypothetical protein
MHLTGTGIWRNDSISARIYKRRCKTCGTHFETDRWNYFYCSYACTQKTFRTRKCPICDAEFDGPSWKTFCGGKCRAIDRLQCVLVGTSQNVVGAEDSDGTAEDEYAHIPFIPEIIASLAVEYAQGRLNDRSESQDIRPVTNGTRLIQLILDLPNVMRSYFDIVLALWHSHSRSEIADTSRSRIVDEFLVDAVAAMRTSILKSEALPGDDWLGDPNETEVVSKGREFVERISTFIPTSSVRRCDSCHVVGDEKSHFRRRKIGGKWGYTNLCIYCGFKDLYDF